MCSASGFCSGCQESETLITHCVVGRPPLVWPDCWRSQFWFMAVACISRMMRSGSFWSGVEAVGPGDAVVGQALGLAFLPLVVQEIKRRTLEAFAGR